MLWLLPFIFFLILTPILQRVREGRRPMENLVDLVFGMIVMLFVAVMWVNLLADQMPCFLRGPELRLNASSPVPASKPGTIPTTTGNPPTPWKVEDYLQDLEG